MVNVPFIVSKKTKKIMQLEVLLLLELLELELLDIIMGELVVWQQLVQTLALVGGLLAKAAEDTIYQMQVDIVIEGKARSCLLYKFNCIWTS